MSFEELIKARVDLGQPNQVGFYNIKCPVCSDYKTRLGLNFNDGIFANCFNCGFTTSYKTRVYPKFKQLLLALGITKEEIDLEESKLFFNPTELLKNKVAVAKALPTVKLPPECESIWTATSEWAEVAREYLAFRLPGVDLTEREVLVSPAHPGFIIFTFNLRGRLVYWQARNLDPSAKFRWLNSEGSREDIIYGFDEVQRSGGSQVFVTEGIMDALAVGGVALLGSTLNSTKLSLLQSLKRDIIFLLQRHDKNAKKLGAVALANGWKISIPSTSVKDVAESVQKYGRLWTIADVLNNTKAGLEGQLALQFE